MNKNRHFLIGMCFFEGFNDLLEYVCMTSELKMILFYYFRISNCSDSRLSALLWGKVSYSSQRKTTVTIISHLPGSHSTDSFLNLLKKVYRDVSYYSYVLWFFHKLLLPTKSSLRLLGSWVSWKGIRVHASTIILPVDIVLISIVHTSLKSSIFPKSYLEKL